MLFETTEQIILAADVGGTNLNLALMAWRQGRGTILHRARFATQDEVALLDPVLRFLAQCREAGLPDRPELVSLSGAGPVTGKHIPLTNAPWSLDGESLERALGIPVQVCNDFTAIAYGVLLLDPRDQHQLLPLPHLDGGLPVPDPQGTVLVVGAGTGLGVGYVTRAGGMPLAHPSEGGHIGLPILDELTMELWRHLRAGLPGPPGAETAVSGPGILTLLSFLLQTGRAPGSVAVDAILALPPGERPAAISAQAGSDPACAQAMALFVDLFARVCAELCAVFLPTGGLFLAGGIAAKNEAWFLDGARFMRGFDHTYRQHLNALAAATPVYLVRDYAISLYGAGFAGLRSQAGLRG